MDHYAVVGNPISHSKSPQIHMAFAAQTQQCLIYQALLAPADSLAAVITAFQAGGGHGMNVTVPFKLEACELADRLTPRAKAAGAVNTLRFDQDEILGDNTDGAGLVNDLTQALACPLQGRRILLLGAGGAARGVLLPLLENSPAQLTIANRTIARAEALIATTTFIEAARHHQVQFNACKFEALAGQTFDIIINATSASLSSEAPPLPPALYAPGALAYDMMYGQGDTPFLAAARAGGAAHLADGLGMLVEQAAESFLLWRGIRPDTVAVRELLRPSGKH